MTLQVSNGFKTLILGPTAFETIFNGGLIRVFSGMQPASASAAETGTYLGTITSNGYLPSMLPAAGLSYLRDGPYIGNSPAQTWLLNVEFAGTAGWFRAIGPAPDDGGVSYTLPRFDGGIAVDNSKELQLPSLTLATGEIVGPIQLFYTIPPIGV